ncbi:ABC transporter ATP-binding protein [Corynebacterium caspium]|uniref:ABC transporter ATP-binding protein n=1 Tax=Corynebacterium caspium TaxID=234828 RepID=UPI00037F3D61|nr:ABC transporter ATP-binding protein [Corynebacterium caspium]WKD59334.1 Putative multidrug export ATP-binding/permease protein [Corynebacterium caspium DSM 44850]
MSAKSNPTSFALASWAEVVREVWKQTSQLPGVRWRSIVALTLLLCGSAANVMVPRLLGRMVDIAINLPTGVPTADIFGHLAGTAGLLIAAAICAAVVQASGFFLISRETERVINSMRHTMIGTALNLPVHQVEEAGTGDLISRSTDDINTVSEAATETMPSLTQSVFMVTVTTMALAGMDWHFLLIPAVITPIYWFALKRYLAKAPTRYAAERAAVASQARTVLETIHGAATVRSYRMEDQMLAAIAKDSQDVVRKSLLARLTMFNMQTFVTICECLMLSTALAVGFWLNSNEAVTVGAVTSAVLMLVRLRGPILQLVRQLDTIQSAYASLARIVGVLAAAPPVRKPAPDVPAPGGAAALENVSFTYPGSDWGIKDFNLRIEPGTTVALVGASGAGKTTIAALLAGMRVPTAGKATIDGIEVAQLSDAQRAARLALISQEVHVFSGTLRADLTLARADATDAELINALEKVRATWWEDLPQGLDTEVGTRGVQLDPVQAQQLALARVLLIDPAVVIMDEATAESGSSDAGELEDAAAELTSGRTAVVVAHRLDQAAKADTVVVMDNGQITEAGPHEDLVAKGGEYATMWQAWSEGRIT